MIQTSAEALAARYDFVIVGGGTAGCVLAARLSERSHAEVLLLEAGAESPPTAPPPEWMTLLRSDGAWPDDSVLQPALGRTEPQPHGRGLGGSSAINALAHVRGHRRSYDAWGEGWSFDDLLPSFRRSETAPGRDPRVRGDAGPMLVTPAAPPHPVTEAFLRATADAGHAAVEDMAAGTEIGFGTIDRNVVAGERQSAADAYLRPVSGRPNLTIAVGAYVTGLRFTGTRATGVTVVRGAGGEPEVVEVAQPGGEVILAGGAVGSAQLLLLSGVGPEAELRGLGIDVVADAPGVGSNLHDHPLSTLVYRSLQPLDPARHGIGSAYGLIAGADGAPDLQSILLLAPLANPGLAERPGDFSIMVSAMQPHSRGRLRLVSADPARRPAIDPGYLSDPRDVERLVAGLRQMREIGRHPALDEWRAAEVLPGPAVAGDAGDDAWHAYLRASFRSFHHLVGTCRLGAAGDGAVVGPDLRVHGLDGLRVADGSVMPSLPSGNTNATVLAIAERAVELIAGG